MPDGHGPQPDKTGTKQAGGRFPPGRSGNPAGRRPGSRSKALMALDRVGDAAGQDILAVVVAAARGGDLKAAELILGRIWPARRDRPVTLALPPIATAGDVMLAMSAVTAAIGAGQVTPAEGAAVAAVLEAQRRVIETTDLAARIARLEAAQPHDEGRDP